MSNITELPAVTAESQAAFLPGHDLSDSLYASRLWLYASPTLIVIGTAGNVMSAVVMTRKPLQNTMTSLYLVVLAVVDTAILYTGLLRQWIIRLVAIDVRTLSSAGCKLHIFCMYFLIQFEAWILVSIAVERLGAIFVPHKVKTLFTKQFVVVQLSIIAGVLAVINMHLFWTFKLQDNDICDTHTEAFTRFYRDIFGWLDFCLASLVPFFVMLGSTVAICIKLLYVHQMRKKNLNSHANVKMTSMTAILLVICLMFFMTTSPIAVYLSTMEKWYANAKTPEDEAKLDLVWASVNILMYTNNASNFFLYCVSGPRFRKVLARVLGFDKVQVHPQQLQQPQVGATLMTNVVTSRSNDASTSRMKMFTVRPPNVQTFGNNN